MKHMQPHQPIDPECTTIEQARDWLKQQVARSQEREFSDLFLLSPVLAEALLEQNHENRLLRDYKVAEIARDIVDGLFRGDNGEPLIVDSNGGLINGQHRSYAVIRAGMPVAVWITFGIDRETRLTLDRPASRSAADYIGFRGISNAKVLSSAAAYILEWRDHGFMVAHWIAKRPSAVRAASFVADSLPIFERIMHAVPSRNAHRVGGYSLLIACHYAISQTAPFHDVAEFFLALKDGIGLKHDSPILYARNRLLDDKFSQRQRGELIFRAWNAHRRGETIGTASDGRLMPPQSMAITNKVYPDVEA